MKTRKFPNVSQFLDDNVKLLSLSIWLLRATNNVRIHNVYDHFETLAYLRRFNKEGKRQIHTTKHRRTQSREHEVWRRMERLSKRNHHTGIGTVKKRDDDAIIYTHIYSLAYRYESVKNESAAQIQTHSCIKLNWIEFREWVSKHARVWYAKCAKDLHKLRCGKVTKYLTEFRAKWCVLSFLQIFKSWTTDSNKDDIVYKPVYVCPWIWSNL